jgi:hypothetical protein
MSTEENREGIIAFALAYATYVDLLIDDMFDSESTDDVADIRESEIEDIRDLMLNGQEDIGLQADYLLEAADNAADLEMVQRGQHKNGDPYVPTERTQEYLAEAEADGSRAHTVVGIMAGVAGMLAILLVEEEVQRRELEMQLMKATLAQALGPDLAALFGGGEEGGDDMPSVFGPIDDDSEGVDSFGF